MTLSRTSERTGWAKLVLWTPLLVGGVVAAVAASRASRLRRAIRRAIDGNDRSPESIAMLRGAILGNDKASVAAALGPPRTAAHVAGFNKLMVPERFLEADTWYYAFDRAEQSVIAIEFSRGVARDAHVVRAPALPNPA